MGRRRRRRRKPKTSSNCSNFDAWPSETSMRVQAMDTPTCTLTLHARLFAHLHADVLVQLTLCTPSTHEVEKHRSESQRECDHLPALTEEKKKDAGKAYTSNSSRHSSAACTPGTSNRQFEGEAVREDVLPQAGSLNLLQKSWCTLMML